MSQLKEAGKHKYEHSESFRYGDMKAHKRHLKYIQTQIDTYSTQSRMHK